MATYRFDIAKSLSLHVGAGVHYTFYTDGSIKENLDQAVGGKTKSVRFSPDWGPIVKLGAAWSLTER